jgi:hypothetical protein
MSESKVMTFAEADTELQRLAKGEHCTISYSKTHHSDGSQCCECILYVSGLCGFFKGSTWDEAFEKLRHKIDPQPKPATIPEQEPT